MSRLFPPIASPTFFSSAFFSSAVFCPTIWLLCLIQLAATGCTTPRSPCQRALDEERYAEATVLCRQEFEADTTDPRSIEAGAEAARAHYFLGEEDAVFAWAERLAGTEGEGRAQTLIASLHQRRGEVVKEREALERSLSLFLLSEDWARASWSLYSLAYQAWEQSRYREALEQAQEAEELAGRIADLEIQHLAVELQYSVLYAVGDLRGARKALDRSLPFLETQPRIHRVRWHHHEASLFLDGQRPVLARAAALRALELADVSGAGEITDSRLLRSVHLNLVKIALRLEDLDGARRHLDAAWSHAEDRDDRTALLFYRARLAQRTGQLREAASDLRVALAEDPVADWAWELELDLGAILEELGDDSGAEAAYRRSTAVVEALRSSLAVDDLKPWLLQRKRSPFEALFRLLVAQGRSSEALGVAEQARARTLLDALVRSLSGEEALASRPTAEERLASLESWLPLATQTPSISSADLLKAVIGRNVVVFFAAHETVWRLVPGGERLRWHPLPWARAELEGKVDAFLLDVDNPEAAAELGDALLPQKDLPSSGGLLHLLPDGPLTRLPFAALRIQHEPIIERYALAYLPSLTTSLPIPDRRSLSRGGRVLIVGDPTGDLPGGRREASQVAELLGIGPPILGEAATLEHLAAAGPLDLLHLATHTGIGPSGPWIALAGGPVTPAALLGAGQAPRLAVLATCASASGPGREIWGSFAAAFLAAGTSSVLGTQRSVEDREAHELVLRFYQEGGRDRPAEALARAQRSLAAEGHLPSSWSPFLLLSHSIHSGGT